MRMSQLFVQTLREPPAVVPCFRKGADVGLPGYQLLLRGGFVRSPSAGSHAFLPLGVAVRARVQQDARRVLSDLGGQEVALPTVQPADSVAGAPGITTPEWAVSLQHAVQLSGERYRNWRLCGSHDRYLMAMAGHVIQSYRQLPALLYHIWQPLHQEVRPTHGLFDSRETCVVDAYSLHETEADRDDLYQRLFDEFGSLVELADLAALRAVTEVDRAGRMQGHRLIWPSPAGRETFVACDACGYAFEHSIARAAKLKPESEAIGQLREVETPDCRTISDLCAFLSIPPSRTAKALFLCAGGDHTVERFIIAVVRGDMELGEVKLKSLLSAQTIRPATEAEIRSAGVEPGYGSPVGVEGLAVIVDDLIPLSPNLVAGANRSGYHLLNVNYGRDYRAALVGDIALSRDGDPCPQCGAPLAVRTGVELAAAVKPGESWARTMNVLHLNRSGETRPVVLGRYRFYIDRLIAAVCEKHHDDRGLLWPGALAPYDVYLMTLGKRSPAVVPCSRLGDKGVVDATADSLYAELIAAGARVLYDDRDERAGVKFNDADLVGLPLRVVVGERGIADGAVEVKHRRSGEVVSVPVSELTPYVSSLL